MKVLRQMNPVVRALTTFAAVAALVTGVTFAALQGQASLVNNTISSATADLQVKSSGSFAAQDAGFTFSGVLPGGSAVPVAGHAFQLKNNGTTDLNIAVSVPVAPTFTVQPGPGSVDLSKVDMLISCSNGVANFTLTSDLATLVSAHGTGGIAVTGTNLPQSPNNIVSCLARAQMDADAFAGTSASSNNFNIVFTGTP
jgi:hypothetical protein